MNRLHVKAARYRDNVMTAGHEGVQYRLERLKPRGKWQRVGITRRKYSISRHRVFGRIQVVGSDVDVSLCIQGSAASNHQSTVARAVVFADEGRGF